MVVDCAWGGRVRTPREGRPRGTSKANNVKINKRRQPTIIRYNLVKVKSSENQKNDITTILSKKPNKNTSAIFQPEVQVLRERPVDNNALPL
mgnify:CR=1 FL=1